MKSYTILTNRELIEDVELQNNPISRLLLSKLSSVISSLDQSELACGMLYERNRDIQEDLNISVRNEEELEKKLKLVSMKYDDLSAYVLRDQIK